MKNNLRVFGMQATHKFASEVADYLDVSLSKCIEKYFPDREPYLRADENVRGCDVYIIQSLYSDENESVNDKFIKLLYFIASLRDASANRISLIVPYLAYQRSDRKIESRAPITTKYVPMLFEQVKLDRILSMDVHNLSALQTGFRIPADHLEAKNLIASHVAKDLADCDEEIAILSPDKGGGERADHFRKALSKKLTKKVDLVHMDKIREGDVVHGNTISSDIKGKLVIAVDDMISSASTVAKCEETVGKFGGNFWGICATHGLFVGDASKNLAKIKRIIITDTIERTSFLSAKIKEKLIVLSTARLFARAIRRTHDEGGSISDLLQ